MSKNICHNVYVSNRVFIDLSFTIEKLEQRTLSINPQDHVTDFIEYLREIYHSLKPETFFPHQSNKFFNLKIVEKCKPYNKFGIDGLAMLQDGSPVKCILIEGAPGCGKSTLVREACQRWGNGTLFQKFSLLLLLKLRDRSIQKVSSLSSCINHHDSEVQTAVFQSIAQVNGKSTILILDGYDELPLELQANSIFASLLEGDLLPNSTIIVTTRSSSRKIVHNKIKSSRLRHIEVLGYAQEEIDLYIKEGLNDKRLTQAITGHLQKNCYVKDLMYLPLNCAIIVYIFKSNNKNDRCPSTLTELYTVFTKTLLNRYLDTHPIFGKRRLLLPDFSDLPSDVNETFTELCGMAYKGVLHGQYAFSGASIDNTLGLMKSFTQICCTLGSEFLHLTLQEYLAAVHISSFPQQKLISAFKSLTKLQHLTTVRRFLAGLMDFKHQQTANDTVFSAVTGTFKMSKSSLRTSLAETIELDQGTLFETLQWLFETQDKELFLLILGRGSYDLDVSLQSLSPFDCSVLGYCIAQSRCVWNLKFKSCGITEKGIKTIAGERLHSAAILDLSYNTIGTHGGVALCKYCYSMT